MNVFVVSAGAQFPLETLIHLKFLCPVYVFLFREMKYFSEMEYNKDEATKARQIVKRKLLANDMVGSKKFLVKAQFMCPELDGVTQMVVTFDLHLSQNIIIWEIYYYGFLGLNPKACDKIAWKRYRELVVMLHHKRNKSTGAEEAFKFFFTCMGMCSLKRERDLNMT